MLCIARPLHSIALIAVALVGCAAQKDEQQAPPPRKRVEVIRVEPQTIPVFEEWTATLEGSESADVRPRVTGYVVERLYEEGRHIEEGAPLFKVDDRSYRQETAQAKAEVARAEAEGARANEVAERTNSVAATGAFSLNALAATRATASAARATVDANEAQLREARLALRWTVVRAPIAGVAGLRMVEVGDLVDPSVVVARIAALDPMQASFALTQAEYMEAADALHALVESDDPQARRRALDGTLELVLPNGAVHPHRGHLDALGLDVDANTGTIPLRALFANPDGRLRPGQFATVRLRGDSGGEALVVPGRAITELQSVRQLAVVDPERDTVALRTVEVGAETEGGFVITKGLAPGDLVVVEGLQGLQHGDAVDSTVVELERAAP